MGDRRSRNEHHDARDGVGGYPQGRHGQRQRLPMRVVHDFMGEVEGRAKAAGENGGEQRRVAIHRGAFQFAGDEGLARAARLARLYDEVRPSRREDDVGAQPRRRAQEQRRQLRGVVDPLAQGRAEFGVNASPFDEAGGHVLADRRGEIFHQRARHGDFRSRGQNAREFVVEIGASRDGDGERFVAIARGGDKTFMADKARMREEFGRGRSAIGDQALDNRWRRRAETGELGRDHVAGLLVGVSDKTQQDRLELLDFIARVAWLRDEHVGQHPQQHGAHFEFLALAQRHEAAERFQ